ncbi:UNVERIFIED_CONTAM: hypothetical protein HDU68_003525 [Siphonaria sp. JEL0065]|nr:hypothetical protein HDU68_003525 [Siphonaria sp. JEL0065]
MSVFKDLTGSADVCHCIPREKFQEDPLLSYLLPHETPYMMFKAAKETHLFTDLAYISIKGESAVSKKRFVDRIEFFEQIVSNVCFETAGMGVTDRDVELKFEMGSVAVSIDIWKAEVEAAKKLYRALLILSHEQAKNRELLHYATQALGRMAPVAPSVTAESAGTANAQMAIATATAFHKHLSPHSYKHVFDTLSL